MAHRHDHPGPGWGGPSWARPAPGWGRPPWGPPPGPRPGAQVTVLRRGGRFGTGVGASTRWVVLGRLREAGVTMLGDVVYRAITPDGVVVEAGGAEVLLPADVVVVSIGQEPDRALADGLLAAGVHAEVVGGARSAAGLDAVRATREALDAARRVAP